MDRLNKKCFVASAGVHLLVGLIAFVGPAFTSSTVKTSPDLPPIDFVPDILTDSEFAGGGNPRAGRPAEPQAPPPQQPPAQPPRTQPKPVEAPRPRDPEPQQPKPQIDPNAFDTTERKKPRLPDISTKVETRASPKQRKPDANVDTQRQERQMAENLRSVANQFLQGASSIRQGVSPATAIEEGSYGPGGGGPTYASYRAYVQMLFDKAWIAPEQTAVDSAEAEVRVVIAGDGTVIRAEFVSRSGDRQMDASVQRALDRVPTIGRPLPGGAKERAYRIRFDLKVKRGLA